MGWEKVLIEEETKQQLDQPEFSKTGKVFAKLAEWKSLPYQIVEADKVLDLIKDKTELIAEKSGLSYSISYSVLLKNSWDTEAALKNLKDEDYLSKTFNFDVKAGKVRAALAMQDQEFDCECCYCPCEVLTEQIMMADCGHRLCTDCFPMYAQEKVLGADGVYATCPDQKCGLILPPDIWKKVLDEDQYKKYK